MSALDPQDVRGVWPLLLLVSSYSAVERGSEWVEPRDLVKAIYVADLEHVVNCWDDWEGFEKFVLSYSIGYVNRTMYLIQIQLTQKEGFTEFGKVSQALQDIVNAARKFATDKMGSASTPSSRELLFCACSLNPELSATLQKSGLNLAKLESLVRKRG